MSNLREILQKNQNNVKKNTVTFELFGETVKQPIRWNNLSLMIVDELYEGNFGEFQAIIDRIRVVAEEKKEQGAAHVTDSLGMPGIVKANLAIIWGLLAGAGEVLTYEEVQEIVYNINNNEQALMSCWQAMIDGDIQEEDLQKLQNPAVNEKQKTTKDSKKK